MYSDDIISSPHIEEVMFAYVINAVKERISLSSIVGRKVSLQRKKLGEFLGLCPFHKEKTPSFHVNDNQGYYHCFGCGAHGDAFSFRMELEALPFKEVLKELASEAGVELPTTQQKVEEYSLISRLYEIYEVVADYYQQQLMTPKGAEALAYLKKRGLKTKTIQQYRLGYAPDDYTELECILNKNFNIEEITQSKILPLGQFGKYNPFKNRVIFPIIDPTNKVIAFGGRSLDGSNPKYLNSSETLIFQKSKQLYALNIAKKISYKAKKILVVEGYMDVISLANYGIEYAVAPLGTSFTHDQLEILWQINSTPTICFDMDAAGQKAALRAAHEALPFLQPERTLQFIHLKGGKDPDEVLLNQGANYFLELMEKPLPISRLLFEEQVNKEPLNTPEAKTRLKNRLHALTKKIANADLAKNYNSFFQDELYQIFRYKKNSTFKAAAPKLENAPDAKEREVVILFAIIKKHPTLLLDEEILDLLNRLEINSKYLDKKRCDILSLTEYMILENVHERINEIVDFQLLNSLEKKSLEAFLQPKGTLEEAKVSVRKICNLHHLREISKQIEEAMLYLQANPQEESLRRLQFLKKEEEKIIEELHLIN